MSPCSSDSTSSLIFASLKQERNNKVNIFSAPFDVNKFETMPPTTFFTTAEFYKTLLASAVFQQQQQQYQQNKQQQQQQYQQKQLQKQKCRQSSLAFRCKFHTNSDADNASIDAKPQNTWSSNVSTTEGAHIDLVGSNINNNSTLLLSPTATHTPTPPDSAGHLDLSGHFIGNRKSSPISSPTTKQREAEVNNCIKSNNNNNNNSKSELLAHGFLQQCGSSAMPIGGVQSQNPSQGLVHWMSVMAEHMSGQSHHDPTPVGMHAYMWNGNVDVSKYANETNKCGFLIKPSFFPLPFYSFV